MAAKPEEVKKHIERNTVLIPSPEDDRKRYSKLVVKFSPDKSVVDGVNPAAASMVAAVPHVEPLRFMQQKPKPLTVADNRTKPDEEDIFAFDSDDDEPPGKPHPTTPHPVKAILK